MIKHHSPAKSGHSINIFFKKAQKTAGHEPYGYMYMYTFTAKDDNCL